MSPAGSQHWLATGRASPRLVLVVVFVALLLDNILLTVVGTGLPGAAEWGSSGLLVVQSGVLWGLSQGYRVGLFGGTVGARQGCPGYSTPSVLGDARGSLPRGPSRTPHPASTAQFSWVPSQEMQENPKLTPLLVFFSSTHRPHLPLHDRV